VLLIAPIALITNIVGVIQCESKGLSIAGLVISFVTCALFFLPFFLSLICM